MPTGFDSSSIRQIGDGAEVVSIIEWKSDKVAEERWFVDTEQWKAAF
ncbi:hypothetical protein [Roseovarius aestuarii]|nr:hypothetical protein [Roseovarius aestuarii]